MVNQYGQYEGQGFTRKYFTGVVAMKPVELLTVRFSDNGKPKKDVNGNILKTPDGKTVYEGKTWRKAQVTFRMEGYSPDAINSKQKDPDLVSFFNFDVNLIPFVSEAKGSAQYIDKNGVHRWGKPEDKVTWADMDKGSIRNAFKGEVELFEFIFKAIYANDSYADVAGQRKLTAYSPQRAKISAILAEILNEKKSNDAVVKFNESIAKEFNYLQVMGIVRQAGDKLYQDFYKGIINRITKSSTTEKFKSRYAELAGKSTWNEIPANCIYSFDYKEVGGLQPAANPVTPVSSTTINTAVGSDMDV